MALVTTTTTKRASSEEVVSHAPKKRKFRLSADAADTASWAARHFLTRLPAFSLDVVVCGESEELAHSLVEALGAAAALLETG
jgi:hypothetical protein